MDNLNICVHVPHSSHVIPDMCRKEYLVSDGRLQDELLHMTDWYTDELFWADSFPSVVFPYSRLVCDVERFPDPVDENMMAKGMGMYYTHGYDCSRIRQSPFGSEAGLQSYMWVLKVYQAHHKKLREMVENGLDSSGKVLIVDAHSFPSVRLPYEGVPDKKRPDICIGTDEVFTPPELVETVQQYFRQNGLTVSVDFPFSGTLVPQPKNKKKDIRVQGIMIEVNRRLYMNETTGEKKVGFSSVRSLIKDMYGMLNDGKELGV